MIASRKAQLADATQRANKAEGLLKDLEPLLADRKRMAEDLANQVELKKQRNRLNTGLLLVLQQLDDAQKRLALVEEKEKGGDTKVQLLHAQVDTFELKYQETKKLYEELMREMETLGIN